MSVTFIIDVSNMSNAQGAADGLGTDGKAFSVNVQGKAQPSKGCSFCWFVVTLYPTLKGMTERDGATFKAHLQKAHGLREEIQA